MRATTIQYDQHPANTKTKNGKANIGLLATGLVAFIVITGLMVGAVTLLTQQPATPIEQPQPTIIITPTPAPTPAPTASPTPAPVPCPSPTPKVGISIEEMTDPEFLALQRLANEALLYGQRPNTPPSNIGVGNVSISESSPYPWDVYGYNDSQPYERRYMWTPEKLRRDGAVNSDADRYTLYNRWLSLQQPQHNINGKVTLYDQDGRLIKPNDPIIVGTLATGVISLTNNQQDDPIAYIAYDVKLYRYNATREELEEMYSFSDDHVEARLLPGQTWTKQIARNIPLQPGRWIGVIKVYNQIDGIMLCEIRTGEYDVGIDHGGGIISFG